MDNSTNINNRESWLDHAAAPTRAIPGELVYKLGQPVPVMADYSAKTT